jgi:hypothetical protein
VASKPTPLTEDEWAKVAEDFKSQLATSPAAWRSLYQQEFPPEPRDEFAFFRPEDIKRAFDAPMTVTVSKPRGAPMRVLSSQSEGIHPPPGGFPYIMPGRQIGKSHLAKMMIDASKIADGTIDARKISGTGFDFMIFDELDDIMSKNPAVSKEAKAALEALADKMTQYFATIDSITNLTGPATLTVEQPGKGYRKKGHVGGEEFKFSSVRIGSEKAGARLIFVLTPEAAAEYKTVELTEDEASTHLLSFRQFADLAAGGDFIEKLREIRRMDTKVRDAEIAVEKMKDYQDFGSW